MTKRLEAFGKKFCDISDWCSPRDGGAWLKITESLWITCQDNAFDAIDDIEWRNSMETVEMIFGHFEWKRFENFLSFFLNYIVEPNLLIIVFSISSQRLLKIESFRRQRSNQLNANLLNSLLKTFESIFNFIINFDCLFIVVSRWRMHSTSFVSLDDNSL